MDNETSDRFWWYLLIGCVLLSMLSLRLWRRYYDPSLTLTFFDVGQGDAALIQFPRGKTLLLDAGGGYGTWNAGSRVLFPELARLGILHLNYALMSHPDNDHAKGFTGIFQELSVDELWLNAAFVNGPQPLLQELEASARSHGIRERAFKQQTMLEVNGATLTIFPVKGRGGKSATNNQSLVLLLSFAGCKILFTGDIEREAEVELLNSQLGRISLLKVPHHGSKTSSTGAFLSRLQAKWAVVSVGIKNRYGHPRVEVLDRIRAMGTEVFRTDFHGAVRFRITPDGSLKCETANGFCGRAHCNY